MAYPKTPCSLSLDLEHLSGVSSPTALSQDRGYGLPKTWLGSPGVRDSAGDSHAADYATALGFLNLSAIFSSVVLLPTIFRQETLMGFALQGFPSYTALATRRNQLALLTFVLWVALAPILGGSHLQASLVGPRPFLTNTISRLQGFWPCSSRSALSNMVYMLR